MPMAVIFLIGMMMSTTVAESVVVEEGWLPGFQNFTLPPSPVIKYFEEQEIRHLYEQMTNKTMTDSELSALEVCVFGQTSMMAQVSAFRLLQFHIGTNASGDYVPELITIIPNTAVSGNYQACEDAEGGQFCYFDASSMVLSSMCVPTACTPDMLQEIVSALIPGVGVHCVGVDEDEFSSDPPAQAIASVLIVIMSLVVIASVLCRGYENFYLMVSKEQEVDGLVPLIPQKSTTNNDSEHQTEPSKLMKVLYACDMDTSMKEFMKTTTRPTNFLNGMRVLSICWVVLGHTLAFPMNPGMDDFINTVELTTKFRMLIVSSGLLAVDTFFFMSAFLACFLILKIVKPDPVFSFINTSKKVTMLWVDRYVRLTPLYALCLFTAWYLLQYMVDGPLANTYHRGGAVAINCEDNWWKNMLYIQNIGDESNISCFGHTWYLANDFQFLILGSFLMFGFMYTPLASIIATVVLLITSWILVAVLISDNYADYSTGSNYYRPWIRFGPYGIGLLTGYVLAKHKSFVQKSVQSTHIRWTGYVVSGIFMFGCMVFQWAMQKQTAPSESHWGKGMAQFQQVTYHIFWGLGLAILTLTWSCGHGGVIVRFLSHPVFEPLGKVTFGVYLIHPMVLAVLRVSLPALAHYSDAWLLATAVAAINGSYLGGWLAFIFIERPIGALWDLASGRKARRRRKPTDEEGEPSTPVKLVNAVGEDVVAGPAESQL
eukprot:TRINITY_DN1757_c0_g1_i5.p1 TRINITY_DN1757_c0_g1~~TRINITY_DN1757_c0_g1_i5.p1  ORF type:complete len:714 (+),score=141.94 TRINITY_DN1757_c0_g1_i5:98-2239(+)